MKTLEEIKNSKGNSAAVFALRDIILGKKKSPQEPVVLVNPENGSKVYNPDDIKEISLKYCVNLLKKKEPVPAYANVVKGKRDIHKVRMLEMIPEDLDEMPEENFNKALKQIRNKPGNKYQFYKGAGSSLMYAIYNLFSLVWRTERIPYKGLESTIIQSTKAKRE